MLGRDLSQVAVCAVIRDGSRVGWQVVLIAYRREDAPRAAIPRAAPRCRDGQGSTPCSSARVPRARARAVFW